jgi:FkbM family methyltransferase
MKIIFQVDGGIGKSIIATAVCKAIKTRYPNDKLIVITGYPEVFLCNPNVDKVFSFNNLSYFYEDHIEGQEVKTFLHNPYLQTEFITLQGHLIKVWCEMFGIPYNGEMPELFINDRERSFYCNQFAAQKLIDPSKPLMLLQTSGGAANQPNKYSWTRDLPQSTAQALVNAFAPEYQIIHIRREDQLPLQNTTPIQADFRALAVLISISSRRLFIDSFAQHAAAALGMPSVVCWVGNTPQQFGYALHTNIVANNPTIKPELRNSVFSRYNISGNPTEFPYQSESEIFNLEQISMALRNSPAGAQAVALQPTTQAQKANNMVKSRLRHLTGHIDPASIRQVLDVGSWHLGQSIEFASIFPDARIDAFEPVPDSYQLCLNHHSQLPDQQKNQIKVHNLALSNIKGEVPFYQIDANASSVPNIGASSMFRFIEGLNGTPFGQQLVQKEITVQSDTLDNWCKRNKVNEVDILWMDAQGAELLVLQGAVKTLKNTRIIMTEVGLKPYYEGHTLKPDIDAFLAEQGFRELEASFELNGFDYEANTIYVRS